MFVYQRLVQEYPKLPVCMLYCFFGIQIQNSLKESVLIVHCDLDTDATSLYKSSSSTQHLFVNSDVCHCQIMQKLYSSFVIIRGSPHERRLVKSQPNSSASYHRYVEPKSRILEQDSNLEDRNYEASI